MRQFIDYHEPEGIPLPSERSLGLTFMVVFGLIGIWPLLWGVPLRDFHVVFLGLGGLFGFLGLAIPKLLYYPNIAWFKFGMLLHKIVNPIVMGIMFYIVISPYSFLMKLIGKKFMPLKPDKRLSTYWIDREPPGPEPETMKYQF